ncbi:hypothetical protein PFISCL1PPCAC_22584, partial [Pristionchus fissidentatus]
SAYSDVDGELLESLDDLGESEDTDLVGELGLVVLNLGNDGGGKTGLDLLALLVLLLGGLVGDEDLEDLASGLLGSGRELGNSGAGLLGVSPYLDVLSQTVELVSVVGQGGGGAEVVKGRDSDLVGDLLLVGVDLSEDLRGEGVLDGFALGELLLGGLVGAEDLDDLSGGLLGGGRELGNSGAGLLGVSLQESYSDVVGELLKSGDDLVEGEESDLVGELGLVVLDLSTDGGGKTGLDLLDLLVLGVGVLVGDEDLDDLSGGLLGGGGQLKHTLTGLLGTVESVDVVIVGLGLVVLNLGYDGGGKTGLDLLDLLVLLLGGLVGDEDLDDLSGGLLSGSRELGNSGAGLLGVSLKPYYEYLDVGGELLESVEDLGKSEDSDLVGELGLVVLDLGSHGGGEGGLDGSALLVLGLSILVRDEDLDDLTSGLLGGLRELGNSGAGLLG